MDAEAQSLHTAVLIPLHIPLPGPSFPLSAPAMSFTKKDEESGLSTYYNNKTTVIQEARVFNESPISPRKCRALLTRIVYLLYVGETFNTQEATTLFFGTTKLFQHKDVSDNSRLACTYVLLAELNGMGFCRAHSARWSTSRSRSSR